MTAIRSGVDCAAPRRASRSGAGQDQVYDAGRHARLGGPGIARRAAGSGSLPRASSACRGRRETSHALRTAAAGWRHGNPPNLAAGTEWTDRRQPRGTRPQAPAGRRDPQHPHPARPRHPAHRPRRPLRHHPAGHLFRTARGAPLNDTGYGDVWQRARAAALAPAQAASLLARRPTTSATSPCPCGSTPASLPPRSPAAGSPSSSASTGSVNLTV